MTKLETNKTIPTKDVNSFLSHTDWETILTPVHSTTHRTIAEITFKLRVNFNEVFQVVQQKRIKEGLLTGHPTVSDFIDNNNGTKIFDMASALHNQVTLKESLYNIINFYDQVSDSEKIFKFFKNSFAGAENLLVETYNKPNRVIASDRILNIISDAYLNQNPDVNMIDPPTFLKDHFNNLLSKSTREWKNNRKTIELLSRCNPQNYDTQDMADKVQVFFGNQLQYLEFLEKAPQLSQAITEHIPRERLTISNFSFEKTAKSMFQFEVFSYKSKLKVGYCNDLTNLMKAMIELESLKTLKEITMESHRMVVEFCEVTHTNDPVNTNLDYSRILKDKEFVDSTIDKCTRHAGNEAVKVMVKNFKEETAKDAFYAREIRKSFFELINALELNEQIDNKFKQTSIPTDKSSDQKNNDQSFKI